MHPKYCLWLHRDTPWDDRIYGITMPNETTYALLNVGQGRRSTHRWVPAIQAQLIADLKMSRVYLLSFSKLAAESIVSSDDSLSRFKSIVQRAREQMEQLSSLSSTSGTHDTSTVQTVTVTSVPTGGTVVVGGVSRDASEFRSSEKKASGE